MHMSLVMLDMQSNILIQLTKTYVSLTCAYIFIPQSVFFVFMGIYVQLTAQSDPGQCN